MGEDSEQKARCRFCDSDLSPKARYCTTCAKFQHFGDRVLNTLDVSALMALVPTVALAAAFLNQNFVRPHSNISAAISRCTAGDTVLAFSNSGSRAGIINDADAEMETSGPIRYVRGLRPVSNGGPPVLKAGETAVVRFELVDEADPSQALEMPTLPQVKCRYRVKLHILEFGGRRADKDLGACDCSS